MEHFFNDEQITLQMDDCGYYCSGSCTSGCGSCGYGCTASENY